MLYGFSVWLSPLIAAFSGFTAGTMVTLIVAGKWFIKGSLKSALYHTGLPTYASASVWRHSTTHPRFVHIIWPFFAFGLFALKVGITGHLFFASYWLIIPALYLGFKKFHSQPLFRALTASLIAHSVGSLIVLHFGAPVAWSSLVAVVPLERIICMAGIIAGDAVLKGLQYVYGKTCSHLMEKLYQAAAKIN